MFVWGTIGVLSRELFSYLELALLKIEVARWAAHATLTLLWALYAVLLLAVGFLRKILWIRLCGLTLFGFSALKLLIFDLAEVKSLYRILSFCGVGILMVAASYLYHRLSLLTEEAGRGGQDGGRIGK